MRANHVLPFVGLSVLSAVCWAQESRLAPSRDPENILQILQQQALPDLIQSITEKKPRARLRVTRISGDAHDHVATQYLVEAYDQTTSVGVRCKILESIGKFHDQAQFKWLVSRLDDPHVSIQCFAIWALGELKNPRAGAFLRRKLWNPNRSIQMMAIDALGKAGTNWATAAEISTFLHDEDVQMRYLAAKALFGVASHDAAPELAERLAQERSLDVQEALARTLGRTGGAAGVGHLIDLLKNPPSSATEHWSEVGLKAAEPSILIPVITPLLEGNDFRLKVAASRIVSELEVSAWQIEDRSWMQSVMRWKQGQDLVARGAADRLLERMKKAE